MLQLLQRTSQWLAARQAEHDQVADKAMRENLGRIQWASWAMFPFSLAGTLLFWFDDDSPVGSAEAAWKGGLTWVWLALACTLPIVAWMSRRAGRPGVSARRVLRVNLYTFACVLGFTIAFVTVDQIVTPSIVPFVIGSIFASVMLLLRPLVAGLLYGLAYVAFFVGMGAFQHDPSRLLSNRANGLAAVVLGLLVAVTMWRKNTVNELLRQQLERQRNALQEQQQQLEYLAAHDGLTGLRNRREFSQLAEAEVARALRYRTETCVILIDLDHFKGINDEHGHPVGDRVLKHIAALLGGAVRATDLVARLGGEEFIILLPHTGPEAACGLAEKLRRLLQDTPLVVPDKPNLYITASLGVAALPLSEPGSDSGNFSRLYSDADQALYQAKRMGRNRVELSSPRVASPAPSA